MVESVYFKHNGGRLKHVSIELCNIPLESEMNRDSFSGSPFLLF